MRVWGREEERARKNREREREERTKGKKMGDQLGRGRFSCMATQKATTELVHFLIKSTWLKKPLKIWKISNYNHVEDIKLA